MAMPGPKPMLDLSEWIPLTLDEARQLYSQMIEAGIVPATARDVLGRLQTLPDGRPRNESERVGLSKVRGLLATLGEPPWASHRAATEADVRPLSSVGRAQPW